MNIGSLDDGVRGDIFLYSGATLNIKDYPTQYSNSYETPTIYAVEENTAVNICNWPGTEWYHQLPIAWQSYSGYNRFEGFHTITFNTNKPLSFLNRYNAPSQWESYIIQNTDPNICSKMNF